MKMFFKFTFIKRLLASLILFMSMASVFLGDEEQDVYAANSNDLRATYLEMMSGRDEENISADMLTMDELRIIALYLSNFYIPFGTSLDGAESRDTSKENCKTALINLGFDKDLAEEVVEMVMAASLSSASQLYMDADAVFECNKEFLLEFYSEYYENMEYMDEQDIEDAGFFSYVGFGSAGANPGVPIVEVDTDYLTVLNSSWSDGSDLPLTLWLWNMLLEESHYTDSRIPVYYISNSTDVKVFEFNEYTSSLWNAIMRNADYSNGMCGNALYNDVNVRNALNSSTSEILARMIFTQPMYVDWVGNIICDCGDERVIVLPACINPYVFSTIEGIGFDDNAYALNEEELSLEFIIANKFLSGFTTDYDADPDYNFNAVSTFGMSIMQDNRLFNFIEDPENDRVAIKCSDVLALRHTIKLVRGGRKDASWDTIFGIYGSDEDGAKLLRETVEELGLSVVRDSWGGLGDPCTLHGGITPNKILNVYNNNYTYHLAYFNSEVSRVVTTNSFTTVSVFDLLAGNGETKISPFSDTGKFNTITGNSYHNFINFTSPVDLRLLKSIFVTYTFAYCNAFPPARADAEFSGFTVNMKFNDIFPKVEGYLQFNHNFEERQSNERAEQVLGEIYWLLHPVKGIGYASTLFKRKIGGILISWHEDIVGATSSNYTTGSTHYLGMSGYVTTPSLRDIAWVSTLLDGYNNIIIYLIILMCIFLLCSVLIGQLSIQQGLIGILAFSVLSFLPPIAINAVIDKTNAICDSIYSKKFNFWALTQLEETLSLVQGLTNAETESEFSLLYFAGETAQTSASTYGQPDGNIAGEDTESGFAGVRLKWMTPKRTNDNAAAKSAMEDTPLMNTSADISNSFLNMVAYDADPTKGFIETYVSGANYLYRDLADIYRMAMYGYNMGTGLYYNNDNATDSNAGTVSAPPITFFNSTSNIPMIFDGSPVAGADTISGKLRDPKVLVSIANITTYDGSKVTDLYISDTLDARSHSYAVVNGFLYAKDNGINSFSYSDYGTNDAATLLLMNSNLVLANISYQRERFYADIEADRVNNSIDGFKETTSVAINDIKWTFDYTGHSNYGVDPDWFDITVQGVASSSVNANDEATMDVEKMQSYKNMSTVYYMLYSESPFYYFNFNIRDQYAKYNGYVFSPETCIDDEHKGQFYKMWLSDNQSYFFNRNINAGDGYNELRDFMNFHDFFYYIMPMFKDGNELVHHFDDIYGMFTYEDCSFRIASNGKVYYGGVEYENIQDLADNLTTDDLTAEEQYKLWHDINVWCLFYCYTTWLDAMNDCDYALPQHINVLGSKFLVEEPLDPTSYYQLDDHGNVVAGRFMVFSRSEMAFYGLKWEDLTTVEQKIITVQDNVYKNSIVLMNYMSFSDENLITSYAMLQLFEFNKEFSQSSFVGESFELYPQGYELKAFTYDAYMRLILSEQCGESLVSDTSSGANLSLYQRIMDKTSIFFGVLLVLNDFVAVYCIPGLRLFFIIAVFLTSIVVITASAIKLELNILTVLWKALVEPLLKFFGISVGLAWIVSLFMSDGISNIHGGSVTISLGDPTMACIAMLIINAGALVLYVKLCISQAKYLVNYAKAVATSMGGTITGLGKVMMGAAGLHGINKIASGVARTARQRGNDNNPISGAGGSGIGGSGGGIDGARGANDFNPIEPNKDDPSKFDSKAIKGRLSSNLDKQAAAEKAQKEARNKTFAGKAELNAEKATDFANKAAEEKAMFHNNALRFRDRARAGMSYLSNSAKSKISGAKAKVGSSISKKFGWDKKMSRAEIDAKAKVDRLKVINKADADRLSDIKKKKENAKKEAQHQEDNRTKMLVSMANKEKQAALKSELQTKYADRLSKKQITAKVGNRVVTDTPVEISRMKRHLKALQMSEANSKTQQAVSSNSKKGTQKFSTGKKKAS